MSREAFVGVSTRSSTAPKAGRHGKRDRPACGCVLSIEVEIPPTKLFFLETVFVYFHSSRGSLPGRSPYFHTHPCSHRRQVVGLATHDVEP